MTTTQSPGKLVDHFFRHEYGRLVALLTKVFGLRNLDLVEDMVQTSLMEALQSWKIRGVPDEPAAWIYRVAKNKVLDALRREQTAQRLAPEAALVRSQLPHGSADLDELFLDTAIKDGLLRMIFACSHSLLPIESRVALTLKTLCGFNLVEIGRALLTNEETVKKRITRAKQNLVENGVSLEVPTTAELPARLETVHAVLYLIFNEGYSATASAKAIRLELCEEAVRLCHLLCEHPHCRTPTTSALMALMLFHAARLEARLDRDGLILLLDEQDRRRWDYGLIQEGMEYLRQSTAAKELSCYHLEAGIAMYHCKAASFADTNWPVILRHYDMLIAMNQSPVYLLNRAIALSFVDGPEAGIQEVEAISSHPQLQNYHLVDSTLGELQRRCGNAQEARRYFERAISKTKSASERQLLNKRLALCVPSEERAVNGSATS